MNHQVQSLLGQALGCAAKGGDQQQRSAEEQLTQFARSTEGLAWAISILRSTDQCDGQTLFVAASVLESTVCRRWAGLPPEHRLAVHECLWQGATAPSPSHPPYVTAKLTAGVAHLACIDWQPQLWPQVQACLADSRRAAGGMRVLDATLEQMHALAQTTSTGLQGKVLFAQIPAIQAHLKESQTIGFTILYSLLQGTLHTGNAGSLLLVLSALQSLRNLLANLPALPACDASCPIPAMLQLLFAYVGLFQASASEELCLVVAAALECVWELLVKPVPGLDLGPQVLAGLCEACKGVQARWEAQPGAGSDREEEEAVVVALVRTAVRFLETHLRRTERGREGTAGVQQLLQSLVQLMVTRRRATDTLLLLEPWHAVMTHLDSWEDESWDGNVPPTAGEGEAQHAQQVYKQGVLHVAHMLLASLSVRSAAQPPPPVLASALHAAPGSGAGLQDWLVGASSAMGAAEEAEAWAQAEAEEQLDGSGETGSGQREESECEVYVRYSEAFLQRAVAAYSRDLLPAVLQPVSTSLDELCAAVKAVSVQSHPPPGCWQQVLQRCRAFEVALRLSSLCGRFLAGEAAAMGSYTQASALPSLPMVKILEEASSWLQFVQTLATVQLGEVPGLQHSLVSAFLSLISQVFKTAGAVAGGWLPQIMLLDIEADEQARHIVGLLAVKQLQAAAAALAAACCPHLVLGWAWECQRLSSEASHSLMALTTIGLSAGKRSPPTMLQPILSCPGFHTLQSTAHGALQAGGATWPFRAHEAVWVALSDICLRSWPTHGGLFDAAQRSAAFAQLASPLVALVQQAAAQIRASGTVHALGSAPHLERLLCWAVDLARAIVSRYTVAPPLTRSTLHTVMAQPLLQSTVDILGSCLQARQGAAVTGGRIVASLLPWLSTVLTVLAAELGTQGAGQLLQSVVECFSAGGGDPTLEADLQLQALIVTVLKRGGAKHQALVPAAVHFCSDVWARAAAGGAAIPDVKRVQAQTLASLLIIARQHWRVFTGTTAGPASLQREDAREGGSTATAHPLARAMHHATRPPSQAAGGAATAHGQGATPALDGLLRLLLDFFSSAASERRVLLAAADVRLVLEELFYLQAAVKVYTIEAFKPVIDALIDALLCMLLSRLYTAAQDQIIDALSGMAAAVGWQQFMGRCVPEGLQRHAPYLSAHVADMLAGLQQGGMEAAGFDQAMLALTNDVVVWQQAQVSLS